MWSVVCCGRETIFLSDLLHVVCRATMNSSYLFNVVCRATLPLTNCHNNELLHIGTNSEWDGAALGVPLLSRCCLLFPDDSITISLWNVLLCQAADLPRKKNHALARVDCAVEKELCCREQANKLPIFRLYSNGFDVSTIRHGQNITAHQMQKMIAMAPVLTQPRVNIGLVKVQPSPWFSALLSSFNIYCSH